MSEGAFHYGQRRLENELVTLEPFEPSVHAAIFVEMSKAHPEILAYIPFPAIETEADFMRNFWDAYFRSSPANCLFAVIDKLKISGSDDLRSRYAGIVSLSSTNAENAATEFGVILFPAFQRTHVASNAIGLLLLWVLDPPPAGGLGLRRVEWQCHTQNTASRAFASRMGFEHEGIARWQCVFPRGTLALPVDALERRNGTKGEQPGRHTAIYSIVWDEWEEKRPGVVTAMERRP